MIVVVIGSQAHTHIHIRTHTYTHTHVHTHTHKQEEMSHALSTMRVAEDSTKIKTISDSTNPLLARRAKKKGKAPK